MSEKSEFKQRLNELRERIRALDDEILERLNERLAVARSIGLLKASAGVEVLDPRREIEVLSRLTGRNIGRELSNANLLRIYRQIISAARDRQQEVDMGANAPALYAVFGDPVGHSLSPLMHTAAFWAAGHNGVYVAVEAKTAEQIVTGTKALGIRGASVTIPHKTAVGAFLDECDQSVGKIGAVNTIVNRNGRLRGFNTDCEGVVRALTAATDPAGRDVLVVGAGGAARAAAVGLQDAGGRVTICNRTPARGEIIAAELDCGFQPLERLSRLETDILINATPVGMTPARDASVVPVEALRAGMVVMDLVYNPIRTRLLRDAAAAGCRTIDGSEMFVHQGARQFELWTGLEAPVEIMRLFVRAALKG